MANLNYFIRTDKSAINKDGTTIIFLRYSHKGQSTNFSTGRRISPDYWDYKNQKIRESYHGFSLFNVFLNDFRQKIEDIVNKLFVNNEVPSVGLVRDKFREPEKGKQKVLMDDFFTFVKKYIQTSAINKRPSTLKGYENTLRHFKAYETYSKTPLTWQSFDMNFYDSFKQYIINVKGNGNTTFGKQIKTLKTILNEAIERGYNVNLTFKSRKFKAPAETAENIFLSEEELKILMELDLSSNERLEKVRDLFIVGCCTGLRFSDFTEIKPENIKDNLITIKTIKTGQVVVIPLHHYILQIMKKYEGKCLNSLPKAMSNQKMNQYLKEIGKLAKFDENIIISRTKGSVRVDTIHKKYELLSTHCARRSFATNLYKQGFPAVGIMRITGHTTEKSFLKYVKINEEAAAQMLKAHWEKFYKKPEEAVLKVA